MDNHKNSFLIYLDSYMHIMALPMEQRGHLFTDLLWYATRMSVRDEVVDVTTAAASCTDLTPEARMAFKFMATTVARDFEKWKEKRDNYQAAARRRQEQKRAAAMPYRGRGVDVYPTRAEERDMQEG